MSIKIGDNLVFKRQIFYFKNMKVNQQAYWDTAASEKKFTTPFQMDIFKKFVARKAAVLDVGCGYGRTMNALYQEGFENLSGIDFSQKMIERGQTLYPYLDLRQCQTAFPFDDHSFDSVVLIAVLTCIVKTFDQAQLMEEIERVLKPDGILYINDFLINHDQRNLDRYADGKKKYGTYGVFELKEGAVLRHHTTDHLFELTRNYEIREFKPLLFTTMNQHISNGFYFLGKLKQRRDG